MTTDQPAPGKKDKVRSAVRKVFRYIGEVVVPILLMGFLRRRKR